MASMRASFLTCARGASRFLALRRMPTSITSYHIRSSGSQQRLAAVSPFFGQRNFASGGSGMSKQEVEGRIMDLLKGFDKVTDASKISNSSHFSNDLGLDSLDTVEVVMAIEEEFSIEIPDKDADAIHSINQAVDYILHQPDAH